MYENKGQDQQLTEESCERVGRRLRCPMSPSRALSKVHLSSFLLHHPGRSHPFMGISLWFTALRSWVSLTHASPLAAETTRRADEETLFVVLFGLIIHGHSAENTQSCFLNSPWAGVQGGTYQTLVAGLPFHSQALFHLLPFSPCHTPHLSWLWLCSLALSE